ncbi:MAG TPA: methyltransferase domain-containing protein, partial [Dehalococcoidia bacterium]|nr:methyltransferase domain-containing protein [Dehalococcoidia bacterium]
MGEPGAFPLRPIGDFYDDPNIAWSLHGVGPHLHSGGEDATVALAGLAARFDFPIGGRVLDLASALGGPARYLARRFGVTVLCVDGTRRMHAYAQRFHELEETALRCPLLLARTERLPLANACCDGAWSEDALCHMDKPPVLAEVARVLRPTALFAFSDWIARVPLTADQAGELAASWGFPSLLSVTDYVRLLDETGFDVLVAEDWTAQIVRVRAPQAPDQEVWEQAFVARFGVGEVSRQRPPFDLWRSLLQA